MFNHWVRLIQKAEVLYLDNDADTWATWAKLAEVQQITNVSQESTENTTYPHKDVTLQLTTQQHIQETLGLYVVLFC